MTVYDWDNTITDQDSTYMFLKWIYRKYPRVLINEGLGILQAAWEYFKSGGNDPENMKEALFSILPYIPDVETAVDGFWREKKDHIRPWYLERRKEDDLIISASPDFLVRPMAEAIGVRNLIATSMSPLSGSIQGANCRGEEKVRRFVSKYPGQTVDEFYSDSLSDAPMAELAKSAYIVSRRGVRPWPK